MIISTTILLLFLIALGLSIVLTQMIRALGIRLGAMDVPTERNIHLTPVPRIGGLAIYLTFYITFFIGILFTSPGKDIYEFNNAYLLGFLGGLVVFVCGLWDDFRRLNPWIKLFFQIAAATLAFIGGAKISGVFIVVSYGITFNIVLSYIITVFWFLLFINAVNLIDGLDGLASGLIFFTSLVMCVSTYYHGDYASALIFAILGGAVLGFLKYNFNPATIFLGDGGSYFLGYLVALVAIRGSNKSHVGVLMLIPLLALGIPIFDAILSPIRRFIQGRSIFQPDREHIHHLLLKTGFSARNAVLLIYGISMGLCILAIFIIIFRGQELAGILLSLLLFGMILLVRKLGYLEYFAFDKIYGWFQDVTDITGISQKRRSFLSLQIEMSNAQNIDELWEDVIDAMKMLKFNEAHLCLGNELVRQWISDEESETNNSTNKDVYIVDSLMKIEIPLQDKTNINVLGKLILIKDLRDGNLETYTIRRMESLRRTLINNIIRLKK